jgi:hypothetical protein
VIAVREHIPPAKVSQHIHELQQTLLKDDCYLPWVRQELPELTLRATLTASQGDPEPVRDGWNRTIGTEDHAWLAQAGDCLTYTFDHSQPVAEVRLVLDSALQRTVAMSSHQADDQLTAPPPELPRKFSIQGCRDGAWFNLYTAENFHQRLFVLSIEQSLEAIRFQLEETWGGLPSRVFQFSVW